MEKVYQWKALQADFGHGLILGNGASIAFDPRFEYQSLKDRATELSLFTADVKLVFDHLQTDDFELVLRMLWHASRINEALKIADVRTLRPMRACAKR